MLIPILAMYFVKIEDFKVLEDRVEYLEQMVLEQPTEIETLRYEFEYQGEPGYLELTYEGNFLMYIEGCVETCEREDINEYLPEEFTVQEWWDDYTTWYSWLLEEFY